MTGEELGKLVGLKEQSGNLKYVGKSVPLDQINVLEQPRKLFNDIPELAQDVANSGLLNPVIIARFNEFACRRYLDAVNNLWETEHGHKELRWIMEENEKIYYVLLAGERRFRSFNYLWDSGCGACLENYGPEKPGECYKRHFGPARVIEARVCYGIPPLRAFAIQFAENNYTPLTETELARSYAQFFKMLRRIDPKYPMAKFARMVGRSVGMIRNAIRVYELPQNIIEAVEKKHIPYGIAIELAYLEDHGVKDLDWWMVRAIVNRSKVKEFRSVVRHYIANRDQSMLDLFSEEAELARKKLFIRRTVGANIIDSLWLFNGYWTTVFALYNEGKLGKEDSPFSDISPLRLFRKQVEMMKGQILPHIQSLLPEKSQEEISNVLTGLGFTIESGQKFMEAQNQ